MSEQEPTQDFSEKSLLALSGWVVAALLVGIALGRWVFPLSASSHQLRLSGAVELTMPSQASKKGKNRLLLSFPKGQSSPQQDKKSRDPKPKTRGQAASPQESSSRKLCAPAAPKAVQAKELPWIAFQQLSKKKRKRALQLLNTLIYPCSCGRSVARCAKVDMACPTVQRVVSFVMNAVHQGQKEEKIRKGLARIALGANDPQEGQQQAPQQPQLRPDQVYHLPLKGAPVRGPKTAKLTVVLFSEFQCPFCSRSTEAIQALQKKFGAQNVRVAYRHFPLDFHPQAKLAAQASMAAHAQGKFWEYHNKLFAHQEKLSKELMIRFARELKLDVKRFKRELESGKYLPAVEKDIKLAVKLRIPGTPTYFINGSPVGDNETLIGAAQKGLKRAEALLKKGVSPQNLYQELIKKGKREP